MNKKLNDKIIRENEWSHSKKKHILWMEKELKKKWSRLYKLNMLLTNNTSVLEIWSWNWYLPTILNINKHNYLGIDYSENWINSLKKKWYKWIIKDIDNEKLDLKNKYDLIISLEVLEHMKTPSNIISEMYKHLSPGE